MVAIRAGKKLVMNRKLNKVREFPNREAARQFIRNHQVELGVYDENPPKLSIEALP